MLTTFDLCISTPAHVIWSTSNGEVLLFDKDSEEICGLEHVAADAFMRLAANQRLSDVVEALHLVYDVDDDVLLRDLTALVHGLAERRLVEIHRIAP